MTPPSDAYLRSRPASARTARRPTGGAVRTAVRGWYRLAFLLFASACQPGTNEQLCAPASVEPDLVRVARTAELRQATQLAAEASSLGITSPLAAVYEYSTFPYQPVIYFVTGDGTVPRERLLDVALGAFEGVRRAGSSTQELAAGEGSLLCTDFDRGSGMVGMSVACAWSHGGRAGYAVRLRGASGPADATPIVSLFTTVSQRRTATSGQCADMRESADQHALPARDAVARDAVAAIHGFATDRLATLFPDGASAVFEKRLDPVVRKRMRGDPLELVAHALGTLEFPRSENLVVEPRTETADRVVLLLKSPPVPRRVIPVISRAARFFDEAERAAAEAAHREAELVLVRDGDGWRIDPEWAIAQVHDWYLRTYVLWPAAPPGGESAIPYGDPAAMRDWFSTHTARAASGAGAAFLPGVARVDAPPHAVFLDVADDSRAVCMSARSVSGERFMKRVDAMGRTTFARGSALPTKCPTQPLGIRW